LDVIDCIALHLIHTLGGSPRRILAGFMIATGFISMWVSNTATTMMMFPIAMAVIEQFRKEAKSDQETCNSFSIVVMMAIAYASSIGGIATLVGTPPNMIFAGQVKKLFPEFGEIVFTRWFLLCFPIAAGFLAISWAYLAFVTGRKMKRVALKTQIISGEIAKLGPWKKDEVRVMIIFLFAVFAWILRSDIPFSKTFTLPGWEGLLGLKGVHDGTVAMAAAVLLFILPSGKGDGDRLLDWPHAVKMPWDVLLLFGGGFALAASFQSTGLAAWLARDFHFFNGMPLWMVIGGFSLVTVFVSEFMSNSPQVTIMTPILAAAAKSLGVHPYWLMIPCTLMTSLAFMMPAGTPPNAIVFGSGHLSMRQMMRTGFVLNLLAVVWVTVMICWLLPLFFNVFLPAGTP